MRTVYEFSVKDRKGKDVSLKEYSNEVLLIVTQPPSAGSLPLTPSWRIHTRNITPKVLRFSTSPAISSDSKLPVPTSLFTSFASSITARSFRDSRRSRSTAKTQTPCISFSKTRKALPVGTRAMS